MFHVKTNPLHSFHSFTYFSTGKDPLFCPERLVTHVRTLHKSPNPILNVLFSLFHGLQLPFSYSQFWSWGMLTDQMNGKGLLIRFFISPCVWITLLRELNKPVRIRSPSRDQLREARGHAPLCQGRGRRLSLERVVKGTT